MQVHTLKRRTPNKKETRVGRGGKRGKTSGKGHKGQKARAGGSPRPMERDVIKKIPKLRGHGKNRGRTVVNNAGTSVSVNLARIDAIFSNGETVTLISLKERGLIPRKAQSVKVLGTGDLTKKLTFERLNFSTSAQEKVNKAGGKVQ